MEGDTAVSRIYLAQIDSAQDSDGDCSHFGVTTLRIADSSVLIVDWAAF